MVSKELQSYVRKVNFMADIFGSSKININNLTNQGKTQLINNIESDLSPENLSCDGELPYPLVVENLNRLTRIRAEAISLPVNYKEV